MTVEYHHLSPVILNDEIFERYVPELTIGDESQTDQRQAAYLIAEQQMIRALRTPLIPTQVSGTFAFYVPYEPIFLPHIYVRSVDAITAYGFDSGCSCDMLDIDACAYLRNFLGIVDTRIIAGYYRSGCGCGSVKPHHFDIAYTAGLPTGTAYQDPSLHLSLSILAKIELLEMLDPGALEGGGGDAGVASYSGPGYSETRTKTSVKSTPLGESALANKAWRLVKHLRKTRARRL
ncbi:MAG: hypothetical protein KAI64_00420 [Thermoplasmata archaeon]|nr:hypothetical protein [Thermoplasmata archaeon]